MLSCLGLSLFFRVFRVFRGSTLLFVRYCGFHFLPFLFRGVPFFHFVVLPIPNWSPTRMGWFLGSRFRGASRSGRACRLVFELGQDLPGFDLDDVAGRRVGELAVDRETDPAWLVFERDAATWRGGITVASKMCIRLLWASASQSSVSSGVRPMPWLGQPCRLVGPFS